MTPRLRGVGTTGTADNPAMRIGCWRPGDAVALLAPLGVGLVGAVPTARAIPSWYRTLEFARLRPASALLLAPYLGWVTFASILNAEIARRNPTRA